MEILQKWLFNFLSSRTQIVLANGARSSVTDVTRGVAQVFLILINDLSENILESIITLFAEDTRVTKLIKNKEAIRKMKNELDKIYKWQVNNNMLFNTHKSFSY